MQELINFVIVRSGSSDIIFFIKSVAIIVYGHY